MKLKGGMEEYRLRFEELKQHVVQLNLRWTEDYFIRCFIGSLKENLKGTLKMLRAHNLSYAIILAMHQENTMTQTQHDIDVVVKHFIAHLKGYKPIVSDNP